MSKSSKTVCVFFFWVSYRCCSECVNDIFGVENDHWGRCPRDLLLVRRKEVFPDVYARRELLEFECFCSNKKRGCKWKGEYPRFREHYSVCAYADANSVAIAHKISRGKDAKCKKKKTTTSLFGFFGCG